MSFQGKLSYVGRITFFKPQTFSNIRCFLLYRPTSLTPEFLWAQRKDLVYLTINVPNVKATETTITLTDEGHIYFKGPGGNVGHEAEYVLDIDLFKPIKSDESRYKITARSVVFKISKADSGPYWDRLLRAAGRNIHCKVDWDNWKDEDEDEDDYSFGQQFADSKDLQDMDFGSGASTSDEEEDENEANDASKDDPASSSAPQV